MDFFVLAAHFLVFAAQCEYDASNPTATRTCCCDGEDFCNEAAFEKEKADAVKLLKVAGNQPNPPTPAPYQPGARTTRAWYLNKETEEPEGHQRLYDNFDDRRTQEDQSNRDYDKPYDPYQPGRVYKSASSFSQSIVLLSVSLFVLYAAL